MKNKKKPFNEELWHLFQEMRLAGKDLVDSIEKADYKGMGKANSMTDHMDRAIQVWKCHEKEIQEWMEK